jgi:hypothetical protein
VGGIILGIVLFLLVFAIGAGFHIPNYKRIHSAQEAGEQAHAHRLITRSFIAARWEVVILVLAVAVMIFKP